MEQSNLVPTKKMSYLCYLCGNDFKHPCTLGRHLKKHIKGPPYYICQQCHKQFHKKAKFLSHMVIHKPGYKQAAVRIPLELWYHDPLVIKYPEIMKSYSVRKLTNKHVPSTSCHFVDLLVMINSKTVVIHLTL